MSILDHPAVPALRAAWQAPDHPARVKILHGVPVPGSPALRSRWLHLLDEKASPGPWQEGDWATIITLEDEGDAAIRRNLRVVDSPRRIGTADRSRQHHARRSGRDAAGRRNRHADEIALRKEIQFSPVAAPDRTVSAAG